MGNGSVLMGTDCLNARFEDSHSYHAMFVIQHEAKKKYIPSYDHIIVPRCQSVNAWQCLWVQTPLRGCIIMCSAPRRNIANKKRRMESLHIRFYMSKLPAYVRTLNWTKKYSYYTTEFAWWPPIRASIGKVFVFKIS